MNIIELFENAGIYRENLKAFTAEDIDKVKKQFQIECLLNPNLEVSIADNLILAINEFPRELLFILNNRILYNFFSGKNYSRHRFSFDNAISVSAENIKSFIDKFLSDNLESFFDQKMALNKFEDIDDFLVVKEYLPERSLDKLNQEITGKLDFVLDKLDVKTFTTDDYISIYFLKFRSFYALASHFSSPENDQKIKSVYEKIVSFPFKPDIKSDFLNSMMIVMANYKPVDTDLAKMINSNYEKAKANTEVEDTSNDSSISPWRFILIAIFFIKMIVLMAKCSS